MEVLTRSEKNSRKSTFPPQIDKICDDFERAWKSGNRPLLAEWIRSQEIRHHDGLIQELIALDIEYRRQAGEDPQAEEYQLQFSDVSLYHLIFPEICPQRLQWALREAENLQDGVSSLGSADQRSNTLPAAEENVSVGQFFQSLADVGILSRDDVRRYSSARCPATASDASEVARTLVKDRKLTEFQATAVLHGQTDRLLLDEYLLIEKIGAGGMGHVFKAQHRRMGRFVALKLLQSSMLGNKAAVQRFQREMKLVARLDHPNIVAAHDAGEQDGMHFLAMEHVDGQDLSAIVAMHGPLPVDEAVDCMLQTARGLAYAHAQGIVHRDVKPGNLLLDNSGVVKILDMGLARLSEAAHTDDRALTCDGQVMGTADYMAPEQAADPRQADARSDIYSLGCTFFRLLTGENVFPGDTLVQKILAHVTQPVPSIRQLRPELPAEIDRIFQKMVAKIPARRYQSMADLIADLERLRVPAKLTSVVGLAHLEEEFESVDPHRPYGIANERTIQPVSSESVVDILRATDASSNVEEHEPLQYGRVSNGHADFLASNRNAWVIIRNQLGEETGRFKVPDGGSVVVQNGY